MHPKDLREIISHNVNDQATLKARLEELKLSENMTYGLEEHIKHIKAKIDEYGKRYKCDFEEYIFIEKFEKSAFVKEVGFEIPYKYKVTVSNLKIGFSRIKDPCIFMHNFNSLIYENCPADYKSNKRKHSDGLYFEFKSNTIYDSEHSIGSGHPINVFLGHNATLSFIENNFEDIDVVARVQNTAVAVLEFKKNISKKPIGIGKDSNEESFSIAGSWRLKKGTRGQIYAANRIEKLMNRNDLVKSNECLIGLLEKKSNLSNQNLKPSEGVKRNILKNIVCKAKQHKTNKIKVTPEQVEGADDKCIIRISDNEFDVLNIFGMTNFYFEGRNIIKQLTPYAPQYLEIAPGEISIEPSVHWGAHQKLDEDGRHFLTHKKIFTILKQRAIANSDTMQEIILQREISKCDHAIVKSEKGWGTYENKAIFLFSKYISNYGTSWIKPLLWLAALNLAIAVSGQYSILIYNLKAWVIFDLILLGENFDCIFAGAISDMLNIWTILSDSQTCSIFWRLLNPTNSLTDIPWETTNPNGWISFLFIFQKVILAVALYEIIKTFRRFGKR